MDYLNSAHKLSAARRALMLPHFQGEAYSICLAFQNVSDSLFGVDLDDLDETPREWITELHQFLDTSDFQHLETGRFLAKAEEMSGDEMVELSRLIDELANWFFRRAIAGEDEEN